MDEPRERLQWARYHTRWLTYFITLHIKIILLEKVIYGQLYFTGEMTMGP